MYVHACICRALLLNELYFNLNYIEQNASKFIVIKAFSSTKMTDKSAKL